MKTYLLKRFLLIIPTFLGITLLTFFIIKLAPGDPVSTKIQASEGIKAQSVSKEILDQLKNTTQKHQRLFLLATLGKISDKSKLKFAVPALRQQLERSKDQQEISLIQTLLTDS